MPGNHNSIGIPHVCGNFELESPTPAQTESLSMLGADLCLSSGLEPHEAIVGHRDQDATAARAAAYDLLPVIRGKAIWYMQTHRS